MKLYNHPLSPNAMRVRAVAGEIGTDLEIVDVDIMKGEGKADWFRALNPNGKVPVLVDGDFVLWESRAIAAYLASLKPDSGLYPEEPEKRAIVDQWSYWQAVHLGPAIQRVSFERVMKPLFGMGEPDESAIGQQLKEIDQFLPVLDSGLSGKDWIAGDLTVAHFALGSTFMYRDPAGVSLAATPNVAAWIDRLEARPSWQTAAAPIKAMMKG